MLQHNARHSSGLLDESLDYILTSLRISESYLGSAPQWLRNEARPLQNQTPRIDRILDSLKGKGGLDYPYYEPKEKDAHPKFFIGTEREYIEKTAAPKLAQGLAEIGIIPKTRKLVYRGRNRFGRIFDLNIYWNRRVHGDDTEAVAKFVEETSRFFFEWQLAFGWSVKAVEFLTDIRMINLIFTGRHRLLPSERWHEVTLRDEPVTGTKRLVVT